MAGLLEQVAAVIFIHNSGVQQVVHIVSLLVQDGLRSTVGLNGLKALRRLHLPCYDERPRLYMHSCVDKSMNKVAVVIAPLLQ